MVHGNSTNFVFQTILSSKNWRFAKLLSFFCLSFTRESFFLREREKILNTFFGPKFLLSTTIYSWKKQSNFAKVQFLDDKIVQNTKFAKLPSAKCFFLYFIIQGFKFCKITQLVFCLGFSSLVFCEGTRETHFSGLKWPQL